MHLSRWTRTLACGVASLALSAPAISATLTLADSFGLVGGEGEIVAFTTDGYIMATTSNNGARMFTVDGAGQITDTGLNAQFTGVEEATSVALTTKGFGAVTLLPTGDTTATVGKVGFFNYKTGALLGTVNVGFHPDSLKFSADGNTLFVADEGEHGTNNVSGSISKIDLTGFTTASDFSTATVGTFDFNNANVAPGAQAARDSLRNNNAPNATLLALEPEFITFRSDGKLLVSLQEANAVGVFDPSANKWTAFFDLGTIANTIDASDKDGAGGATALKIDDLVKGMPMPDAIASFSAGGHEFFVTANEGDFRTDDADRKRVKDFNLPGEAGADINNDGTAVNSTTDDDNMLGRLRVSIPDSDPDGDTYLEDVIMPGTRSFTIWNANTGSLVLDSGSLETFLASVDPLKHNINNGSLANFDTRSPDKGPEPEGLDVIVTPSGEVLVVIGLERQNGLILARIDTSDAINGNLSLQFLSYINNLPQSLLSPESVLFVPAADSPTRSILVLAGYEGVGGSTGGNAIAVYTIPEPSVLALVGMGLCAAAMCRRRHA